MNVPLIFGMTCVVTEPWMINLLDKLLKEKDGMFIDVGVNVGQTLIKLKALDPERRYVGFEPNPACVFYVNELIKENKFKNCILFPIGLFTQDRVLSLNLFADDQTDAAASLIAGYRPGQKIYSQIYVPVFRFESVSSLLSIDNVGIIKIDVEGAELEVIKSLSRIIRDYRPIILLEVLPVRSNENVLRKDRQEELEQIFNDLNYIIFRVKKTGSDIYAGLKRIESIGIHSNLNQCDYVIAPNEISARLQDEAE
jgi:FkbM family methyltransferase